MYRVLIADDESIIREGLKKIISWDSLGFEVIGTASDGRDAYRKINALRPDLCIIDIRMPGLDGLELISKIKKQNPDVKIIILTGYPEFGYAQKAVDLGVETFLLKPIDPAILEEKVKEIFAELEQERKLKYMLGKSIELSKERLIYQIVRGNLEKIPVEEINRIYNFQFPWKSYQIALLRFNDLNNVKDLDSVAMEIGKALEPSGYSFYVEDMVGILFKDFLCHYHKRELTSIKNLLKSRYGADFTVYIGKKVSQLEEIRDSFDSAMYLVKNKFWGGRKDIVIYPEKRRETKLEEEIEENEIIERIERAIECLDTNSLQEALELKLASCLTREGSEDQIRLSYLNIYLNVIHYFSSNYSGFKENSNDYLNEEVLNQFYKKESLLELNKFTEDSLFFVMEKFAEMSGKSLIFKVLEYIDSNYYTDLKLQDISQKFGYNSCYFGKLFKKSVGESFNTYLSKVRINKAKEFLLQDMKVLEVAEKVGYKDADYFIQKFKEHTGQTPKSFKEEMMSSF